MYVLFYLAELQRLNWSLKELGFVVILVQNLYHDPVFSLTATLFLFDKVKLDCWIQFSKMMLLYVTDYSIYL